MRLVLDPEWEVCYIEITKAESKLLEWPPHRTSEEISALAHAVLAGAPNPYANEPPGFRELIQKAYVIADVAWPYYRRYRANRRADPPECTILGIEARVAT